MAKVYRQKLKPVETFFGGGKGMVVWTVVPVKPPTKPAPPKKKRKE